jgi:haloalkane dehalogenase
MIQRTPTLLSTHSGRRNVAAFLVALSLGAAACSSDDASDSSQPPSTEAVAESNVTAPSTTDSELTSTTSAGTSTTAADAGPDSPEIVDIQVASGIVPMAVIKNGPEPALPAGAVERRIPFQGHDIFAIEIPGEGPPIVLAHGFPDSLHLYDELFPLLAGRRVIAFDFIGWGRSDKPVPASEYQYTTAAQTAEMAAVIDAYELTDVSLVVHDQSAPVGLDYVVDNQDRIGELIFLNGFYAASPNLFPPKGIEVHNDPRLQAVELAVEADPAAIEALHRFQMDEFIAKSPNEAEVIDTLWSQFGEARPAFIAINDILSSEVAGRLATVERLRTIEVPVDIVYGALDPYLTPELAQEFDELLPNSTLTLVEDAGHYVQIDSPEIVAEAIFSR